MAHHLRAIDKEPCYDFGHYTRLTLFPKDWNEAQWSEAGRVYVFACACVSTCIVTYESLILGEKWSVGFSKWKDVVEMRKGRLESVDCKPRL